MKKYIYIAGLLIITTIIGVIVYFKNLPEATSVIEKNENKIEKSEQIIETKSGLEIADITEISNPLKTIKENSELFFTVDGMTGTKGRFNNFEVEFIPNKEISDAKLNASIESKSIFTASTLRDEHLLEADFFDVKNFPEISFNTVNTILTDTGYLAKGELNFLGNKKEIDIPFQYKGKGKNNDETFHVFEGGCTFNRIDFGMKPNSMVGDIVTITFYIEMK